MPNTSPLSSKHPQLPLYHFVPAVNDVHDEIDGADQIHPKWVAAEEDHGQDLAAAREALEAVVASLLFRTKDGTIV
jgi:hypothetical protein